MKSAKLANSQRPVTARKRTRKLFFLFLHLGDSVSILRFIIPGAKLSLLRKLDDMYYV